MTDAARPRQMVLGALISPASSHIAGWRHPDAISNVDETFDDVLGVTRIAEDAKLDFVFIADELAMPGGSPEILSRDPVVYRFEPLTLVSALAVATERIGLIVTQSTTYNEPYHVARKLASIDQLSRGRSGWNLVTSYVPEEAQNFSRAAHLANVDRYQRAEEFLAVTNGLWDSWDDDAFVMDRADGRYFDPSGLHVLDHHGEHFTVRGPLNVRRPVQGRPVQVQAGSSEAGRALAGRFAEVVFTAQRTIESALAFSTDIRDRVKANGRDPERVKIIAGVQPIIGDTMEAAQEQYLELQSLIHPEVGLARLSQLLDFDVTGLPLDAPLPDRLPETENYKSRRDLILDLAQREGLTLGQLIPKVVSNYGHRVVIGTPESIADELIEWFEAGAIDGYIVSPTTLPAGLDRFTREVVPLLVERGVFRSDYSGTTLRDHLGLERPSRGGGV